MKDEIETLSSAFIEKRLQTDVLFWSMTDVEQSRIDNGSTSCGLVECCFAMSEFSVLQCILPEQHRFLGSCNRSSISQRLCVHIALSFYMTTT